MNWDAYFKFDAIYEFLDHIASSHPEICSLQTIGKTVEGREIKLIKISSGGEKKKPAVFIEGGFCKSVPL
jgi:carboxypeptidase A4